LGPKGSKSLYFVEKNIKGKNMKNLENLFKKFENLKDQNSSFLFYQKNSLLQQIDSLEKIQENDLSLIEKNEEDIMVKNYSIQLLEMFKDYKLNSRKDTILNIINTALKDIFDDAIYIDIEQEVKSNGSIKYNIIFFQQGIAIAKNEELLESNGGGILAVISILFKILIGYLYSKNRLYIFDESFAQVSPQYRERLSLFLRQFAEKYNFTIILVSQTSDLNKFAHIEYNVNFKYDKDIKELYIEDKRENREEVKDKLDRYEIDIKNFQSIKHIKFEYQGFTVLSGPNNSGKSASLRAFKSIIFNDFKERYQRINTKVTDILLKKIVSSDGSDDSNKKIKLTYKSKKVIFELDGQQYLGKNLASDILKNYIEENFGLKFIDIKSLYKNIKGDLRKQVESIAYNSQHDSLFLIGSKSNDIEKVFNFLFNTELITAAIAQLKEEIYEINDILKDQKNRFNENKLKLESFREELTLVNLLYNIKIIDEYNKSYNDNLNIRNTLNNLKEKINVIKKDIQNIESYSNWINYFNVYFQNLNLFEKNKNTIQKSKNDLNEINERRLQIEKKLSEIKKFELFDEYLSNKDILKNINNKIDKLKSNVLDLNLNDINILFEKILSLRNYIENDKNLTQIYQFNSKKIKEIKDTLNDIPEELNQELRKFNIVKCSCCNGLGYHKIK